MTTIVSALAIGLASVLTGQLICAALGSRGWSYSAPAVGLGALMLVTVPGLSLPGRTLIPFVVVGLLSFSGAALLWRHRAHRPPRAVAVPVTSVCAVVLLPFLFSGRFGTLGVGLDDDMWFHLLLASAFGSPAAQHAAPAFNMSAYPIGPHAVAGTLSATLGISVLNTFTGFTIALMPLLCLTVAGQLRELPLRGAQVAAFVVALSYLLVSYMGQGSFKEVSMVVLLFGTVDELEQVRLGRRTGPGRLVPLAVIVGGILSVYSTEGLWWPLAFTAGLVLVCLIRWAAGRAPDAVERMHGLLVAGPVGLGALILVIAPQLPRLHRFYNGIEAQSGTGNHSGIPVNNIGNLVGPLDPFEATGSWLTNDYRFSSGLSLLSAVIGTIIVCYALIGLARRLRHSRPELPVAAVACGVIWAYSALTQSPYVAAKALTICSPFLLTLAAETAIVSVTSRRRTGLAYAVAGACLASVVASSALALEYVRVGPAAHQTSMSRFQSVVRGRSTLVFELDPFAPWYLLGSDVNVPGTLVVPNGTGIPWKLYRTFGWRSVSPEVFDRFQYVVAPIDPATGDPPPNFALIETSGPYALFKRQPAALAAAARLRSPCRRSRFEWPGFEADTRYRPRRVDVGPTPEGTTRYVRSPKLAAGRYYVNLAYLAPEPVRVTAPGLSTTLPATLEGIGTFWPVGWLTVPTARSVELSLAVGSGLLSWSNLGMTSAHLQFTRMLPAAKSCGTR